MGAIDPAMSIVQCGDENLFDGEMFESDTGADNVRDRIEGADFMKVDVTGWHPVDVAFGVGNAGEDAQGVGLDERGEIALRDEVADLAMIATGLVVAMSMAMRV